MVQYLLHNSKSFNFQLKYKEGMKDTFYLYAPFNREASTNHGLGYNSCGALAGMKNGIMGPPGGIDH